MICWLTRLSVCHNFLKGREVTLPCNLSGSTCLLVKCLFKIENCLSHAIKSMSRNRWFKTPRHDDARSKIPTSSYIFSFHWNDVVFSGPPRILGIFLSHCSVIIMQTFYWEICHSLEKVKDYNVCILFLECMSVCNVTARYICTCIHLYEKSIVDKVSFHTYYIVMPFSKDTSRIVSRDRLPPLSHRTFYLSPVLIIVRFQSQVI